MEQNEIDDSNSFEQLRNEYVDKRYRNIMIFIDSSKERYPELYQLPENE